VPTSYSDIVDEPTFGLEANVLAVHGLAEGDRELAELFGTHTGDEVDKSARSSWHPGPGRLPVLDTAIRWFAGEILDRDAWGNHRVPARTARGDR
jgi:flavin reductase (DIM6/NTAB) family NADH-FMN oxidoreductase RutF